eukprot:Nitzschia sp. Nitz4//scaffold325_size20118//11438//12220//NITZ4_008703-RA/size20118-processed-gene-0.29-mRNA-1//-1//CDS//3329547902//7749//frame0
MVETDELELILKYVALPLIIGLSVLSMAMMFDFSRGRREDAKLRRVEEMNGARETYKRVMEDAERLLFLMRYHAWNIAWRKMRPEGIFSEYLIDEDERKWGLYDEALMQWRKNRIQYKIAIETYFGKRGSIARLFHLIDATFDKLSFEMWFIYHENPNNPNVFLQYFVEGIDQKYATVFNAIMTSIDKEISREQEEKVHQATSLAFDELQDKIHRMCTLMASSIHKGNIGFMRKGGRIAHRQDATKSSGSIESSLEEGTR